MTEFKYEIHYTGSTGNSASVYYDDVSMLIDIGKPYKFIEPLLFDKDIILLSHRHGDHVKPTTYGKIREHFPHIQILGNQDTNNHLVSKGQLPLDIIFHDDFQFQIGDVKFTTIQNLHGADDEKVDTHGFILESPTQNLLFATDLSSTIFYEKYCLTNNIKFDIILLEANYDPQVIEFYEGTKNHTGYNLFSSGSYRHLPITDRKLFVDKFSKPGYTDVELHQSATYRSFEGLIKKSKGKITQEDVDNWLSK